MKFVPVLSKINLLHGLLSYFVKYLLIISSLLGLNLLSDFVHTGFIIISSLTFLFSSIPAIYRSHHVVLYSFILKSFGEPRIRSCAMFCNVLISLVRTCYPPSRQHASEPPLSSGLLLLVQYFACYPPSLKAFDTLCI